MIAIIDYNAGNVTSVKNAIERLGFSCIVTSNAQDLIVAEKVIFPGVGEAGTAMSHLKEYQLDSLIPTLKQPVLGICLGLQLMCNFSEEGNTPCLGIFNSAVKKFPPLDIVPHMGWNTVSKLKGKLFEGITENDDMYFVHSYFSELLPETSAVCNYILPFSAALEKNNFYATQFHPEKSSSVGEQILRNFLKL